MKAQGTSRRRALFAVARSGTELRGSDLVRYEGCVRSAGRNWIGLTQAQVSYCVEAWVVLCGARAPELDTSEATRFGSRTRFDETHFRVMLGADVWHGGGVNANSRLSVLACLAHELAHVERYELGYRRPTELPDAPLDEAETIIRAAFTSVLSRKDREDLVEDARDRLIDWLASWHQERADHEG